MKEIRDGILTTQVRRLSRLLLDEPDGCLNLVIRGERICEHPDDSVKPRGEAASRSCSAASVYGVSLICQTVPPTPTASTSRSVAKLGETASATTPPPS